MGAAEGDGACAVEAQRMGDSGDGNVLGGQCCAIEQQILARFFDQQTKALPVSGSWSNRGAPEILDVVLTYSPTVEDCSSWAPQR